MVVRSRIFISIGFVPRPPVQTIADELFFTTVLIEATNDSGGWTGTGFLLTYPAGQQAIPVLVTNRHVFAAATHASFTLTQTDGTEPLRAGTRLSISNFGDANWVGHPDPAIDVAVMFFNPVLEQLAALGAPAFFRSFTPDLLATQASANELDSIEQVTFVGYPNGLFDRESMSPIVRRGHTATPIFNDYNGSPAFLIDASVFPGSSGSPVVLFDRGTYTTRDGTTHVGSRIMLLGVVAAVYTRRVNGTIEMVSRGQATFDDVLNLGIVFKSSAIQECVDAAFSRAGVSLAPTVPSPDSLA